MIGVDELYARSRRALLDALEALAEHRDGVILIGAHAVYLYTGEADVPARAKPMSRLPPGPRTATWPWTRPC